MSKVLFAFSGGIDDVLSVYWLRQLRGYSVIALLADIGQHAHLEPLGELALECGAEGTVIVDLRERFIEQFAFPALASGAHYEGYLLATPLARYAICEELVRRAGDEGLDTIGHGSSSHGNDLIRFQATIAALKPDLQVITPLQDRRYASLEEKRADIKRLRLPMLPDFENDASFDRNLWGCGSVHGSLADPWQSPDTGMHRMTVDPADTPKAGRELMLGFHAGIPVSIDGKRLDAVTLVEELNELAGQHGIGRLDHIENRVFGGKTREIYEAPAATLLYQAHQALEQLTQSRDLGRFKRSTAEEYGRLIYEGMWFSELREALDAFVVSTQRFVSGDVRLRLMNGQATVLGRRSPHTLYDAQLLDSPEGQARLRDLSKGFVDLFTLPNRSEAYHRRAEDHPR